MALTLLQENHALAKVVVPSTPVKIARNLEVLKPEANILSEGGKKDIARDRVTVGRRSVPRVADYVDQCTPCSEFGVCMGHDRV